MDMDQLLRAVQAQYALDWDGTHGLRHLLRVRENGLRLAETTGAKVGVVELFAFLHDSRREKEGRDPQHGPRAVDFARSLRGSLVLLEDEDFALLARACELHTKGFTEDEVTVQTCWDADRLDIGRVGMKPRPEKLCTEAARNPLTIRWAWKRSLG
jgi:uncharacterized protein